MLFLHSAYLFDYRGWYFCFQLTFLTTRDDIPSFSLPLTTRDDIPSCSLPLWLQGMIFFLPAYLFDYKGWYFLFQLTFLTTGDDIPHFNLPFWQQRMILLFSA
jgi:hypothetical protein